MLGDNAQRVPSFHALCSTALPTLHGAGWAFPTSPVPSHCMQLALPLLQPRECPFCSDWPNSFLPQGLCTCYFLYLVNFCSPYSLQDTLAGI